MEIKSTLTNRAGQVLDILYYEVKFLDENIQKQVSAVHAFCFYDGKLIVVYSDKKGYWSLPGGAVEQGETPEEAVIREVKEESNMQVISQSLIGYQEIFEPDKTVTQSRSVCIVKPYGKFENDPDGDVTEIKLIDPKDYKKYVNWGVIGDRLMEQAIKKLNSSKLDK